MSNNDLSKLYELVNTKIKQTEDNLKEFPLEIEYKKLSWKKDSNNKFRLFLNNRPFIENKFTDRVENLKHLDGLLNKSNEKIKKILEQLNKEGE